MEVEQTSPTMTEGLSEGTESQATGPGAQAPDQQQNVNPSQVERQEPQATSQDETRRSEPSEFAKNRREIRQLRETVARFEQALGKLQNPTTVSPQSNPQSTNPDDFWKQFGQDPTGVLNRLLDEREKRFEGKIPQELERFHSERQLKDNRQEALKLIHTNEAIKKDPDGIARIEDILFDDKYGLEEMSKQYPLQAARIALALYEQTKVGSAAVRRNPNAPSRGQMMSTATAVQSGAKPDLGNEAKKLQDELTENPMKAYDPSFQERLKALQKNVAST